MTWKRGFVNRHFRKNMKINWTRYRSLRYVFWVILAIVLYKVTMAALPFLLKSRVEKALSSHLGGTVKIHRLHYSFDTGLEGFGVEYVQKQQDGSFEASIGRLECDFSWLSIHRGLESLNGLAWENARFTATAKGGTELLQVTSPSMKLVVQEDRGRLAAELECSGIGASFTLYYSHLEELLQKFASKSPSELEPFAVLWRVHEFLKECDFGWRDSHLDGIFVMDGEGEQLFQGAGRFSVEDSDVMGVAIEKLRGFYTVSDKELHLEKITWLLERNGLLSGEMKVDFANRRVQARGKGEILPQTFYQMTRLERRIPLVFRRLGTLVDFSFDLPDSPWDWRQMAPRLEIAFADAELCGIPILKGEVTLTGSSTSNLISIPSFHLQLNREDTEYLAGEGDWDSESKELHAKCHGALNLVATLEYAGCVLPETGRKILNKRLLSLEGEVSGVTDKHDQWNGILNLGLPECDLGRFSVAPGEMRVVWKEGRGCVEDWAFTIKGESPVEAHCHLEYDSREYPLTEGLFPLQTTLSLRSTEQEKPILDWKGRLSLDFVQKQFSMQGDADVALDKLVAKMPANWDYPGRDLLELFELHGNAIHTTLEVPAFSWATGMDWRVLGEAQGENVQFDKFHTREATCRYEIDANEAHVSEIHGTTVDNDEVSLDLRVNYKPFQIVIQNLRLAGDPMLVMNFIFHLGARDTYSMVWKELQWEDTPVLFVKELRYESSDMDGEWLLTLDGTVDAEKFQYQGMSFDGCSLGVHLRLPSMVSLAPVELHLPNGAVKGDCAFQFTGQPQCTFHISETKGTLPIQKLLSLISPTWGELAEGIAFAPDSEFPCEGAFYLNTPASLTVFGSLKSDYTDIKQYRVEDVEGVWSFASDQLNWKVRKSRLFKGKLLSAGHFNFNADQGSIFLSARGMSLDDAYQLLSKSNKTVQKEMPGILNTECHLSLMHDCLGRPWSLEGNGVFSIRHADILQIPVMKQLGVLLGMSRGIGSITELNARLEFLGTRLAVPEFSTNGTIIALDGQGAIDMEKKELHFQCNGEALRKLNIFSWIFKPLTWAFQAELTGPLEKPEWHLRTRLRHLIPGIE